MADRGIGPYRGRHRLFEAPPGREVYRPTPNPRAPKSAISGEHLPQHAHSEVDTYGLPRGRRYFDG